MKKFLSLLLLTILAFSAAPAYGQGEDPPDTSTETYQQDIRFEHKTTDDSTALSNAKAAENLLQAKGANTPTDILILTDEQGEYPLGGYFEILEDKEKQWTIEDVTSPDIAAQFVPSQEGATGFGFTDSAYWIRFQVTNESKNNAKWLLDYEADAFYVDYFLPVEGDQGYKVIQTGTARPFSSREVPVGRFVFNLPIAPQEMKTIHMRLESAGSLILSFSILSDGAFVQKSLAQHLQNGILYGILLILAIYNLVYYFYLRDISYLHYVLYFGTTLLAMMALDGIGAKYLWPNQGAFGAIAPRTFLVLSFTFAVLFATSFLRTKEYAPRLHKIMITIVLGFIIGLGLQLVWFRTTAVIHVLLLLAGCLSMVFAGLLVWHKGYHPARFFLIGWAVVLAGFTIFLLTLIDVISLSAATDSVLRVGLIILAFVLSIGLADRINIYRQEKEAAQLASVTQRSQIAQELHDSVTQSLYSANLFAEAGQERVEARDTQVASHYFKRIGATTQQALKEMRLFLYESRPPDVVEVGLVDALQKRIDVVEMRSGMEARLRLDGEVNYSDDINDQFFRIAQEALNNVLKHAQADEVTVYLRGNNHRMELEVVDNGRGFDLAEARQKGGMGLEIMHERAAQINGYFTITTAPGQGTTIAVEVKNRDA